MSEVSETNVKNCFTKVGISKQKREDARDDDDPFKEVDFEELQSVIDELHEKRPNEVPSELNPASLVDVYSELVTNSKKHQRIIVQNGSSQ